MFASQYYDKETKLNHNVFRDYDPTVGRFLQSDPIGLYGGFNNYTYVYDNPLKYIDPYGLAAICLDSACIYRKKQAVKSAKDAAKATASIKLRPAQMNVKMKKAGKKTTKMMTRIVAL